LEHLMEATVEVLPASAAGRSCPVSYRYGARALATPAALQVESLWVAGGLYGNPFALEALIQGFEREAGDKALVFNGDFHWFDAEPAAFEAINDTVLSFHATRGNVETEVCDPAEAAGCGCAYPAWVDEGTVVRSNRIIERLRDAARRVPQALTRLAALPMHLRVDVGGLRVGVVHGDADSLAGWGFAQEVLATPAGREAAAQAFASAAVDVFASSHTCLPVLQSFGAGCALVNNGAAGMPNFRGEPYGLATRIATSERSDALYRVRVGAVVVEAIPLRYDGTAWARRFAALWPPGSDAHVSYHRRITEGPQYRIDQALRS
jgi:predicted phosphodiesterase